MKRTLLHQFATALAVLILMSAQAYAQNLEELLAGKIDIVVDINGSGNFTSIGQAINSVTSGPVVIFVKDGVYYEKVEVEASKTQITMIGESIDGTILAYDDFSGSGKLYNGIISSKVGTAIGTSSSHTFYIDADNFTLLNMTVANTAGNVGQAVALNLGADKTIIAHCRILGNQDTFYTWGYGRFYIADSYVQGAVDFIFGRGTAVFDSCIINSHLSGHLTAASTEADWKFGYVFRNCRLTADLGVSGVTMGRPWRENAQTVFMNCQVGAHIVAKGWSEWDGREKTCFYAEYNNFGPGANTSGRASWSNQLTDAQAATYTLENMFAKEDKPGNFSADWAPALATNEFLVAVKTVDPSIVYNDTLFNNALLAGINYGATPIANFKAATRTYNVELPVGTTDVPQLTAVTQNPKSTFNTNLPGSLPGNATIVVTAPNTAQITYTIKFTVAQPEPVSIGALAPTPEHSLNNPFGSAINLKLTNRTPVVIFALYNMEGKQVLKQALDLGAPAEQQVSINTNSVKPGTYAYTITQGSKQSSGTLVKQ